ncbi:MAG: cellulase, partial [Acidobacteriota bacterium]|nr:cellulase [Acidobacteriota bacterium]
MPDRIGGRSGVSPWLATLLLAVTGLALSGCRRSASWPSYQGYLRSALQSTGRIADHTAGERTTSEGQAYALFFALVSNDRTHFDQILRWTEDNLAGGDLSAQLPAWSWGRAADGSWRILDANPASDADLWMAYTLLEAGRLWHNPRYTSLGTALADQIARQEVILIPALGATLLSGPHGFHPYPDTWLLNPSYMPPQLIAGLASYDPQGPWGAVLSSVPVVVAQGSANGFAMDWVSAGASVAPAPAPAQFATGNVAAPAYGSYDAIRVYLWLGTADPETPGVHEALSSLTGMSDYLQHHPLPPERVDDAGNIVAADSPVGFSAAVLPYLEAVGLQAEEKAQADRLQQQRDPGTGLWGSRAA